LENPFILVVLIGIISSFYKQMKGTGEDEGQKRKQPKPFLPGQSGEKSKPLIDFDFGEIQKRMERPKTASKKPEETPVLQIDQVKEIKGMMNEQRMHRDKKDERQTKGRLHQPRMETAKKENELPVTSQTLRDAVIWSEILGPPRARQIYHRKRTNTHY
jgi:hypothetical protein